MPFLDSVSVGDDWRNHRQLFYALFGGNRYNNIFPLDFKREELTAGVTKNEVTDPEALTIQIADRIGKAYKERNEHLDPEQFVWLERHTVLDAIDQLWHTINMKELYDMGYRFISMGADVIALNQYYADIMKQVKEWK